MTRLKRPRSLKPLVGAKVYGVWCEMLEQLAPDSSNGQTATVVAAMLQFAAGAAWERYGKHPEEGSVAASLFAAIEGGDHDEIVADLADFVGQLFRDAGAATTRRGTRHRGYKLGPPEDLVARSILEYVDWGSDSYYDD
jgi:hypothetical protein